MESVWVDRLYPEGGRAGPHSGSGLAYVFQDQVGLGLLGCLPQVVSIIGLGPSFFLPEAEPPLRLGMGLLPLLVPCLLGLEYEPLRAG